MIFSLGPLVAEAATVTELALKVNRVIINPLITFAFAAGLAMFLYGMVRFLANRDMSSEEANNGKRHMIWGIVGMFIMLAVFGIIQFIINTIGVKGIDIKNNTVQLGNPTTTAPAPTPVPGTGS